MYGSEQSDLLLQIVADNMAIPALRRGFDEVAHERQKARDIALWCGARRRGRVETGPARVVQVNLDPGVRVTLANRVRPCEAIVGTANETCHVARGHAQRSQ